MRIRLLLATFLPALLYSAGNVAYAKFDADHRSIHYTGETLNAGEMELGLWSFDYAPLDSLMLEVSTLRWALSEGIVAVSYKFVPFEHVRLTPRVWVDETATYSCELAAGIDFGEEKEHSLTVRGIYQYFPLIDFRHRDLVRRNHPLGWPEAAIEYDYYHRGNMAYGGINEAMPYFGYTWAWENWHAGFISSMERNFFPIPYVYYRF
jgi:hypothetical protein